MDRLRVEDDQVAARRGAKARQRAPLRETVVVRHARVVAVVTMASGSTATTASTLTAGTSEARSANDVDAAAQPDRVADHVLAIHREQRPRPDLPEHGHRPAAGVALAQRGHARSQRVGGALRNGFAAGELAQAHERLRNIRKRVRLVEVDRDAETAQRFDARRRRTAAPDDDEVRLERENLLHVEQRAAADPRDRLRRLRIVAELRRPRRCARRRQRRTVAPSHGAPG